MSVIVSLFKNYIIDYFLYFFYFTKQVELKNLPLSLDCIWGLSFFIERLKIGCDIPLFGRSVKSWGFLPPSNDSELSVCAHNEAFFFFSERLNFASI